MPSKWQPRLFKAKTHKNKEKRMRRLSQLHFGTREADGREVTDFTNWKNWKPERTMRGARKSAFWGLAPKGDERAGWSFVSEPQVVSMTGQPPHTTLPKRWGLCVEFWNSATPIKTLDVLISAPSVGWGSRLSDNLSPLQHHTEDLRRSLLHPRVEFLRNSSRKRHKN